MKIYFPEIGEYGLVAYAVKIVSLLFSYLFPKETIKFE